jgi:hypothetical protein
MTTRRASSPPADRRVFRSNQYYELRFPRMTKAYRRRDRAWRECISLEEFQRIARETVGRERPNKEADDWCKNLFGKVASPGVKHPLRRKQREEAILADLEKVERNHRDGGRKSKNRNSGKRKRAPEPSHHPKDRRSRHHESTYLENAGQAIERSPLRAVLAQQRGRVSFTPPITPTRPRLSRSLAPLGSVTNVTVNNSPTPPGSPLDDKGRDRLGSGELGKEGGSKDSKASDLFVDEEGYKRNDRVGLETNMNHPFIIPVPPPLLSLPTATLRRQRMDLQGDADLRTAPGDPPTNANIDAQLAIEQITPSMERNSQSITGRSLPTPVSNGPIKHVPPLASSPTAPWVQDASTGVKRKRDTTEDVHSHSKKVVTTRSSPSAQKVPGPSRGLRSSATWSPDKTSFME